ncbi:hypothetical protein CUU54_02440 [Pectobacterium polaris]|uniref:hypothetical protein n=1 Tax=Pectobacterium polaris TaxID=2042057 RepID=UPI000D60E480|nr:hypothetical protein [Pectobacterium polaris]MCU1787716.1 hypothetical protein [Pectobacterium polaris]PWD54850.1 hypothetical protein DF209_21415 [Pectobacterium polaris]
MNALTNERLEEIASAAVSSERILMANELLSLRAQLEELGKQEPVAYGINIDGRNIYRDERSLPIYRGTGHEITPVYAEPVPQAVSQSSNARWCPSVDPISGSKLFIWMEHPTLGCVPTYGGPYDSFTLTERDENGEFFRHRYDHDEGAWVDDEAVYLDEQQGKPYTVPDEMAVTDEMTVTAQMFAKGHNACRAAILQSGGKS